MEDMVEITAKKKESDREEPLFMGMTVKELKSVKDAVLQLKQGEALERGSWPRDQLEGFGLGFFGHETLFALSLIDTIEDTLNDLAKTPNDRTMHQFALEIAVGSGSRGAKRLELTMDTIGKLGGSLNLASKEFPTPEHLGARQPDK